MFARIGINTAATIMPFYLDVTLGYSEKPGTPISPVLAIVPLVSYLVSMIYSMFFQAKVQAMFTNRRTPLIISVMIVCLGSIPMMFLSSEHPGSLWLIYPLAAL
jgi:Na+/melibiose symporter-like transporter